jgi:hypothetical protein
MARRAARAHSTTWSQVVPQVVFTATRGSISLGKLVRSPVATFVIRSRFLSKVGLGVSCGMAHQVGLKVALLGVIIRVGVDTA